MLLPAVALLATAAAPHDVHVSQARVFVDGASVAWRLRVFEDDLERGLRGFAGDTTLTPAALPPARLAALLARYLDDRVALEADGTRLAARVLQTSTEDDPDGGPVRWIVFTHDASAPIRRLRLRHALLFEVFRDQQNLVTLQVAGGRRLPLYFAAGDDGFQDVPLR